MTPPQHVVVHKSKPIMAVVKLETVDSYRIGISIPSGSNHSNLIRDCGIELDDLGLPDRAYRSTDHLVPQPGYPQPARGVETDHSSDSGSVREAEYTTASIPNYKPLTNGWPFQVLLLVLIAGVMAFLEYEMHHLHPVDFQLFYSEFSGRRRIRNETDGRFEQTATGIKPTPGGIITSLARPENTRGAFVARIPTTYNPASRPRHVSAPQPTPEPIPEATPEARPPASLYPGPVTSTTTYCGWRPPEWGVSLHMLVRGNENGPETIYSYPLEWTSSLFTSMLPEYQVPTFVWDDESWCPCVVDSIGNVGWGVPKRAQVFRQFNPKASRSVYSPDKECHSVIHAIVFHNAVFDILDLPEPNRYRSYSLQATGYTTTDFAQLPSTPDSPLWLFPSTNAAGSVLLPLWRVTYTAGQLDYTSAEDMFGNPVDTQKSPSWVATVPAILYPDVLSTSPPDMTWWTLPLFRSIVSSTTTAATATPFPHNGSIVSFGLDPSTSAIITSTRPLEAISETLLPFSSILESSNAQFWSANQGSSAKTTILKSLGTATVHSNTHANTPNPSSAELGTLNAPSSLKAQLGTLSDSLRRPFADVGTAGPLSLGVSGDQKAESPETTFSPISNKPSEIPVPVLAPAMTITIQTSGSYSATLTNLSVISSVLDSSRTLPSLEPVLTLHTATVTSSPNANRSGPVPTSSPWVPPSSEPFSPGAEAKFFNICSSGDFIMASLLPVLLTTLLAIAIQVFVSSLNTMLPFRALTSTATGRLNERDSGSNGKNSILLARSNPSSSSLFHGPGITLRFLQQCRDPLPLFSFLLSTISTILVPMSNEVIHLELTTECGDDTDQSISAHPRRAIVPFQRMCAFGLRKQDTAMRTAERLLVAMAILIISTGYILLRWRSGLLTDPWSLSAIADLTSCCSAEFRQMIGPQTTEASISTSGGRLNENTMMKRNSIQKVKRELLKRSEGLKFRIGFHDRDSAYGIKILHPAIEDDKTPIRPTTRAPRGRKPVESSKIKRRSHFQWLASLSLGNTSPRTARTLINTAALTLTSGLLGVILYYENTEILPSESTGFESFMSGQSFGVRVLFTALGTVITLFWDDYFSYISSTIIHTHLSKPQKPATNRDFLLHTSPPAHIFDLTAIYRTMVKTRDWPSLSIALACFLAKFTPILLSNIPLRNTITWDMHEVCTWMAVGVFSYMVVVLGAYCLVPSTGWLKRFLPFSGKKHRGQKEPGEDKPSITASTGMDNIAGLMYYSKVYYKDMLEGTSTRTV